MTISKYLMWNNSVLHKNISRRLLEPRRTFGEILIETRWLFLEENVFWLSETTGSMWADKFRKNSSQRLVKGGSGRGIPWWKRPHRIKSSFRQIFVIFSCPVPRVMSWLRNKTIWKDSWWHWRSCWDGNVELFFDKILREGFREILAFV